MVLTDAGRAVLADARRLRMELQAEALRGWPDADVEALAALIERFNASVRDLA